MWCLGFITLLLITQMKLNPESSGKSVILRNGNDACEGHVEIYIQNKWGIVGDHGWNNATEKVICRSTYCGSPVEGQTVDVLRPLNSKAWLNQVNCRGNERDLLECYHPGEGISFYSKDTVKKIKCSRQVQFTLDHSKCSGIVQYSFEGRSGLFCSKGFGKDEANALCERLGCGKAKIIGVHHWLGRKHLNSRKVKLNCAHIDNLQHLWQCVTTELTNCIYPASVTCQDHKRMQLRGGAENVCSGYLETEENGVWVPYQGNQSSPDELCLNAHCGKSVNYTRNDNGTWLTCKEKVTVSFRSEPNSCYGFVNVERNNRKRLVCSEQWGRAESEVVCRELNCGLVISYEQKTLDGEGIMNKVSCLGNEASIWHCSAMRSIQVQCPQKIFVVCSGSLDVRLKDGLSKSGGRLEILHGNVWMQLSKEHWIDSNTDVVCKQLSRSSGRRTPEKYSSKASEEFLQYQLQCRENAVDISECFSADSTILSMKKEALEIECQEHKVLILRGDDPCSGLVEIENNNNVFWLSGSNATWNQKSANAVCQQKHCGNATSFYSSFSKITNGTNFWDQFYNCSPDANSLFDCETLPKPPADHNSSIAAVKCSGNITITLTNKCWGEIKICLDSGCGNICQEYLQPIYSDLCKSLQCGDVVETYPKTSRTNAKFKRLHKAKHTPNLTQSIIVINEEQDTCSPAYVVCSGSRKPRFNLHFADYCSGNLEVFHSSKWLPVCEDGLQKWVGNMICKELECGSAVENNEYFGPSPGTKQFLNLQCQDRSKTLSDCKVSVKEACKTSGLKCTAWRKMGTLNTCSGPVLVYSEGQRHAVAVEGWTDKEGRRLCLDLQCGGLKSLDVHNTTEKLFFWNSTFSCGDNQESIWDCEKPVPPVQRQQLYIQCQETPKVTLSENCQGLVEIDGKEVCSNSWSTDISHMVCQEQQCGNAVATFEKRGRSNTDYFHVRCESFHHELGQCRRVLGKCKENLVSVICVDSVRFNTTEKCGGKLLISYGDKWEHVCPMNLSETSHVLCHELGCSGYNHTLKSTESSEKMNLETSIQCSTKHQDIKYCVIQTKCKGVRPAEIYCNGYEPQLLDIPQSPTFPVGLLVGLSLLVLIIAFLIILICIFTKCKRISSIIIEKVLSKTRTEIESGVYEEVHSHANEMEELSRRTSRPVNESLTAEPAWTSVTLTLCEEAEAHPLNSDEFDGESYDDIDSGPEVFQTQAEINHCPQSPADSGKVEVASMQDSAHHFLEEHVSEL